MDKVIIKIGDKTYNCQLAKTEEQHRQGLMDVEYLAPDEGMKNSGKYFVYQHINKINNKCYIGITSATKPELRWNRGFGYKSQVFYRAIEKYGWDGFYHVILHRELTENQAKCQEMFWIKLYKSENLSYNVTNGGEGSKGVPMPETTKQALLKANIGRQCSEETKRRISESEKGKKCSEENKLLYKTLFTGRSLSEETKQKITKNNKKAKVTILVNLQTGEKVEFSSGRQASLWLGLCEDAVVKAIKKGHLLKDGRFKAYRK